MWDASFRQHCAPKGQKEILINIVVNWNVVKLNQ